MGRAGSSEASLPGVQTNVLSLSVHTIIPLCVSLCPHLLLLGRQSCQIRDQPSNLILPYLPP